MYDHILIPTDGSAVAQAGVEHGLALAKVHGGRVTAITVTEPMGGQFAFAHDLWSPSEAEAAAYDEVQQRIAESILASVKARADALGVPIQLIHLPWRTPGRALVEAAEEGKCSVIVMSSHGRTGVNQLVLGSQTAIVLAGAKVPVLVVR